jgi:hypothetical protein
MKKAKKLFFIYLLIFVLPIILGLQQEPKLYRVVYVKGNPIQSGHKPIRDGQKMNDTQKVVFSSMDDVIILLTESFDKVSLRPSTKFDLKRPMPVKEYANIARNQEKLRMETKTRGPGQEFSFQSMFDTLSLDLKVDLKKKLGYQQSDFKLLNLYMENLPDRIKKSGEVIEVFPGKPGIYSLHLKNVNGLSEVVAELEFLDNREIRAELKFVAETAPSPDSVSGRQIRYVKKLYPGIPQSQFSKFLMPEN